jgi:adenylyltransferase/sulfurtransferase
MSCNLLALERDSEGKVATTPTMASIVAGLEVQEAVKLLHGLPSLAGHAFIFEGLNHTSYKVEYTENDSCMSHHTLDQIVALPQNSGSLTLDHLFARAQQELDTKEVTLEFSRDVVHKLACSGCGGEEELFAAVGTVPYGRGRCPSCGRMRSVTTAHGYTGSEAFGKRPLDQLGLPLFDVFTARSAERELAFLVAGDDEAVLGEMAVAFETRASGASQ